MATGGRVLHHLKTFAPDHRDTILFTGYQAGGTRGAAMLQGAESIKIHGEYVLVCAEVAVLDNLSAMPITPRSSPGCASSRPRPARPSSPTASPTQMRCGTASRKNWVGAA
jgi:Cft2 family RNA processing exonuclease